jgi:hypothetical protein
VSFFLISRAVSFGKFCRSIIFCQIAIFCNVLCFKDCHVGIFELAKLEFAKSTKRSLQSMPNWFGVITLRMADGKLSWPMKIRCKTLWWVYFDWESVLERLSGLLLNSSRCSVFDFVSSYEVKCPARDLENRADDVLGVFCFKFGTFIQRSSKTSKRR